jgi:hypothetical protein
MTLDVTEIELPRSRIGDKVALKMPPDGTVMYGKILDDIVRFQKRYLEADQTPRKALVLQRIRAETGVTEVRLGYYILGKKPAMKDKWVWGQYCTMLPANELLELVEEAKARGWFE